jgi:hypothetical protein
LLGYDFNTTEMMDFMPPVPNEICFAPMVDIIEVRVSITADDIEEACSELFLLQLRGRAMYPVQVTFNVALSVTTITIVDQSKDCAHLHTYILPTHGC